MRGIIREQTGFIGLFFLLASLIMPDPALAQSTPQLQFDRANNQLEAGHYQQALSIYNSISESRTVSGSLYLNMAISYVQLDSLGKAKYFFLKAQQFEETRDRSEQGLEFVESQFSRQSAVLPKLPWKRFFDWLGATIGSTYLLGIGIILFNLGISLYIGGWFWDDFTKAIRWTSIGIGTVSVVIILSSFYVQYLQDRYSRAIMVHQRANVLEQPDPESSIVSQAYEGYSFTVDHRRSREYRGWSYVRMSNGLYGWIPNEEIMVL